MNTVETALHDPVPSGGRVILFAPGIHLGGGRVLLDSILPHLERDRDVLFTSGRDHVGTPDQTYIVQRTGTSWLRAQAHLRSIAKDSDVVICFASLPPVFRTAGRKVILFHNQIMLWGNSRPAKLRRAVFRTFYKRGTPVMCQSEMMSAKLMDVFGVPTQVMPFISVDRQAPRGRKGQWPPLRYLYPAGTAPHKNHRRLVEAWASIHNVMPEGSDLALTIPKDHAALEDINCDSLGITPMGWQEMDGMPMIYDRSDALVFPSLSETLALPPLEAAVCEMPCIIADRPYAGAVIEPAFIFDPMSVEDIASAILKVATQAERPDAILARNRRTVEALPGPLDFLNQAIALAR